MSLIWQTLTYYNWPNIKSQEQDEGLDRDVTFIQDHSYTEWQVVSSEEETGSTRLNPLKEGCILHLRVFLLTFNHLLNTIINVLNVIPVETTSNIQKEHSWDSLYRVNQRSTKKNHPERNSMSTVWYVKWINSTC